MQKNYSAKFELWDLSAGREHGDLLEESETYTFSPLGKIEELWSEYTKDAPAEVEQVKLNSVRVSMSRNGGAVIIRRYFMHEGAEYGVFCHLATEQRCFSARLKTGEHVNAYLAGDKLTALTVHREDGEAPDVYELREIKPN